MIPALAPALVIVLGQSALRSLLLGALVLAALRLARLRDLRAETHIWTAVLALALAMPFLTAALPGVALTLPGVALPSIGQAHSAGAVTPAASAAGPSLPSVGLILTGVYLLGAGAALLRILIGLVLVAVLYFRAEPIGEPWAQGRAIRASAAVDGPLSFARCIVLPADYAAWPETKLIAVLAHEECHVGRGDFFIQLLASLHRALFWFSPFPWWLQRKLGELAETASDAAGARRVGDPARYAEILIDVARAARRRGALAPQALAMAHGPGLAKRVDHLLALPPERALGQGAKGVALSAITAAALTLAGLHGAALAQSGPASAASSISSDQPAASPPTAQAAGPGAPSRAARPGVAARASSSKHARKAPEEATAQPEAKLAAADPDQPSYDSLAALRDHDSVAVLPVILTGRGVVQ
jgi:beta-lactamase regulating signal transducer with metallopeptidase domain